MKSDRNLCILTLNLLPDHNNVKADLCLIINVLHLTLKVIELMLLRRTTFSFLQTIKSVLEQNYVFLYIYRVLENSESYLKL